MTKLLLPWNTGFEANKPTVMIEPWEDFGRRRRKDWVVRYVPFKFSSCQCRLTSKLLGE